MSTFASTVPSPSQLSPGASRSASSGTSDDYCAATTDSDDHHELMMTMPSLVRSASPKRRNSFPNSRMEDDGPIIAVGPLRSVESIPSSHREYSSPRDELPTEGTVDADDPMVQGHHNRRKSPYEGSATAKSRRPSSNNTAALLASTAVAKNSRSTAKSLTATSAGYTSDAAGFAAPNPAEMQKYKDAHLKFIADLAEKNRKEKEQEAKRAEHERRRREKLVRMILGKEISHQVARSLSFHAGPNAPPPPPPPPAHRRSHDGSPFFLANRQCAQPGGSLLQNSHLPSAASKDDALSVQRKKYEGSQLRNALSVDPALKREYEQRHLAFLDKIAQEKKKREEESALRRQKEEQTRNLLKKKLGVDNVESTREKWFGFAAGTTEDDRTADFVRSRKKERRNEVDSKGPHPPVSPNFSRNPRHIPAGTSETVGKAKSTLTAEKSEQLVARLAQPPKRSPYTGNMDWQIFRKRNGISEETKVFQVLGGYHDVKKALLDRGWFFNADPASPFFDYRFTLKGSDIDFVSVSKLQLVNHFQKNSELTSKVGLCRNIRNVHWYEDVDMDSFFPRCFYLEDPDDMESFVLDFKMTGAESILRSYQAQCAARATSSTTDMDTVRSALKITHYRLQELFSLKEDLDPAIPAVSKSSITEADWNRVVSWGTISTVKEEDLIALAEEAHREGALSSDESDDSDADEDPCLDYSSDDGSRRQSSASLLASQRSPRSRSTPKRDATKKGPEVGPGAVPAAEVCTDKLAEHPLDSSLVKDVDLVLNLLSQSCVYYAFNGKKNIWIVKPGRKSRGRGIQCFSNFNRLMAYTQLSRREHWVVQKYCENPMVIHRRKFDIRQWVVAVDYDPLYVFFYNEAYLRFCSVDFTLDEVENRVMHLSNNSVQKRSKQFGEDDLFVGNMWHTDTFRDYLKKEYGYDAWTEKIQPAMKDAVRRSMQCGQDAIPGRKNSFELFGYDFVVDEDLNVWLIEINSSPDLSYSTPITEDLVKDVSEDVVKVSVDWMASWKGSGKRRNPAEVDTGKFELIFAGPPTQSLVPSMGSTLVVQGVGCGRKTLATTGGPGQKKTSLAEDSNALKVINI